MTRRYSVLYSLGTATTRRATVHVTDGYTTVADIPRILAVMHGCSASIVRVHDRTELKGE